MFSWETKEAFLSQKKKLLFKKKENFSFFGYKREKTLERNNEDADYKSNDELVKRMSLLFSRNG